MVNYLHEERIANAVAKAGEFLLRGLARLAIKYPTVIDSVRGKGLLCAMELCNDEIVGRLTRDSLEQGLLITPTRNKVVRCIPSLLVSESELTRGLELLDLALSKIVSASRSSFSCSG